jgi:hypothetical protein
LSRCDSAKAFEVMRCADELDAALRDLPCVCHIDDGLVQEWVAKARAVAKSKGLIAVERGTAPSFRHAVEASLGKELHAASDDEILSAIGQIERGTAPQEPNAHGIGPDTDGGPNPDYIGERGTPADRHDPECEQSMGQTMRGDYTPTECTCKTGAAGDAASSHQCDVVALEGQPESARCVHCGQAPSPPAKEQP